MGRDESLSRGAQPLTRRDLREWIHDRLNLEPTMEATLLGAIDGVFTRHEELWQQSKQEAIQALSAAFSEQVARLRSESLAKDATSSNIWRYFEDLIADLTEKVQRDPKTKLMNFNRFLDQMESYLALEQRGRWCAVGLVDITGFKWYNDALGHPVGDRIIARVAQLLCEQVRSDDLLAQQGGASRELHARFGGDEFCFLVPELHDYGQAYAIAERFREAVERYDWTSEDDRLEVQPVRVDVGVVCLQLGPLSERRYVARKVAADLIRYADKLMYEAKGEKASHIYLSRLGILNGEVRELDADPGHLEQATDTTRESP